MGVPVHRDQVLAPVQLVLFALRGPLTPCVLISAALAALRACALSSAVRLLRMQDRSDRAADASLHPHGGEGWLVNGEQELIVQFRPLGAAPQTQWVELRTFRWVRPHPPVPQSQRRMLRSSAIDAWQHMLKVGWRRCAAPVR
ncbi:DUF1651 domain-containing protein [Synechococcus sp. A18-25c]|uniref:DUF1651 domain-containing protein n=1 Tax=Synechococcus sp. A18-25c TaxID=1866938 RepID=UPI00351C4308